MGLGESSEAGKEVGEGEYKTEPEMEFFVEKLFKLLNINTIGLKIIVPPGAKD